MRFISLFFVSLSRKTISLPFRNTSLFNKFHSIDGCPGPVNNKPIDTASINKLISTYNPFDSLTANVAHSISIIKSIVAILLSTPNPPITSNNEIITTILADYLLLKS